MIIIMLGAQGTGKGTVAGLISGEIGIPQISTGDIFRKNISEKTPLGIEAEKYISKGNLVPDEITVPMVEDRLTWEDAKNGVILDGFPRTIEQAEKFIIENLKEEIKIASKHVGDKDYKTVLQEKLQIHGEVKIEYITLKESGPDHDKTFEAIVRMENGIVMGHGVGKTKKEAEQNAAKDALSKKVWEEKSSSPLFTGICGSRRADMFRQSLNLRKLHRQSLKWDVSTEWRPTVVHLNRSISFSVRILTRPSASGLLLSIRLEFRHICLRGDSMHCV